MTSPKLLMPPHHTHFWLASFRNRHSGDLESLLAQLDPQLEVIRLLPIVPDETAQRAADDELWRSIHGFQGLHRMCHNAGFLVAISRLLAREFTDHSDDEWYECVRERAKLVRFSLLATYEESLMLGRFHHLPVCRVAARQTVDQYMEMCASVRAMIEYHHSSMIALFDGAV